MIHAMHDVCHHIVYKASKYRTVKIRLYHADAKQANLTHDDLPLDSEKTVSRKSKAAYVDSMESFPKQIDQLTEIINRVHHFLSHVIV